MARRLEVPEDRQSEFGWRAARAGRGYGRYGRARALRHATANLVPTATDPTPGAGRWPER